MAQELTGDTPTRSGSASCIEISPEEQIEFFHTLYDYELIKLFDDLKKKYEPSKKVILVLLIRGLSYFK